MNDYADRALLPAGLRDILPPAAAHEADVVRRLLAAFAAQGYQQVKPPLIEFEESLLAGGGGATAGHSFRVMDPVSQRMMAVRADFTPQVARIATTRLANAARPLRLSYAGQVLRVKGSQLRPERQSAQAGFELIGPVAAAADAEVIILAAQALLDLGMREVSVDLSLPRLGALVVGENFPEGLRDALDHKDAAAVAALGGAAAPLLGSLVLSRPFFACRRQCAGAAFGAGPAAGRRRAVPATGRGGGAGAGRRPRPHPDHRPGGKPRVRVSYRYRLRHFRPALGGGTGAWRTLFGQWRVGNRRHPVSGCRAGCPAGPGGAAAGIPAGRHPGGRGCPSQGRRLGDGGRV